MEKQADFRKPVVIFVCVSIHIAMGVGVSVASGQVVPMVLGAASGLALLAGYKIYHTFPQQMAKMDVIESAVQLIAFAAYVFYVPGVVATCAFFTLYGIVLSAFGANRGFNPLLFSISFLPLILGVYQQPELAVPLFIGAAIYFGAYWALSRGLDRQHS